MNDSPSQNNPVDKHCVGWKKSQGSLTEGVSGNKIDPNKQRLIRMHFPKQYTHTHACTDEPLIGEYHPCNVSYTGCTSHTSASSSLSLSLSLAFVSHSQSHHHMCAHRYESSHTYFRAAPCNRGVLIDRTLTGGKGR